MSAVRTNPATNEIAWDGLADEQGPIPTFGPIRLDDEGRIVITDEEIEARADAIVRMLRVHRSRPDRDPPGSDEEFMRHRREPSRASLVQRDVLNMSRITLLDSGPLGLLCLPPGVEKADRCRAWIEALVKSHVNIFVPAGSDYEVRRELKRLGAPVKLAALDDLRTRFGLFVPTDDAWLRAAEFWAIVRRAGKPTADPQALDADCILAAQASLVGQPGDIVTIATSNVGHLNRFPGIDAREWASIAM